jgi:hypothetical protein
MQWRIPLVRFRIGSRCACLGPNHNRSIIFMLRNQVLSVLHHHKLFKSSYSDNLQVSLANSMLAFAYPPVVGPETPADARISGFASTSKKPSLHLPCHETEGDARLTSIGTRCSIVLHVGGSRVELQVAFDDLVNCRKEILLRCDLSPRTNCEHASFCRDASKLGSCRIGAQS